MCVCVCVCVCESVCVHTKRGCSEVETANLLLEKVRLCKDKDMYIGQ